tara:strand:+ start:1106 stop:1453 length:348 start_codon:yes stop_codon:yes gene_type:complete
VAKRGAGTQPSKNHGPDSETRWENCMSPPQRGFYKINPGGGKTESRSAARIPRKARTPRRRHQNLLETAQDIPLRPVELCEQRWCLPCLQDQEIPLLLRTRDSLAPIHGTRRRKD